MQVGKFINTDRLADAVLIYEPTSGSFLISGPNFEQNINQAQVLALHKQKVIDWENLDILRLISGEQNMVADAPFKGVDLPTASQEETVSKTVNKKALLIIGGILLVLLVIGIIIFLGINKTKLSLNTNVVNETVKPVSKPVTISPVITYFNDTAKKIKTEKDWSLYKKNVRDDVISETLASTYIDVYKTTNKKIDAKTLKTMKKKYSEEYLSMVERRIKNGDLFGTVFDGKATTVEKSNNNTFILSVEVKSKTHKFLVAPKGKSYQIINILEAKELQKEILGVKE